MARNLTNDMNKETETITDLSVPLVQPLFEIPDNTLNCPICFEDIHAINVSITTCGHAFHCFCLLKAVENNIECPLCRHELLDIDEEDETTNDDDEETNDDEATEDMSIREEDSNVTLEQLAAKMTNLGYTMKDLLYMMVPVNTDNPRYTDELCDEIYETIDKIKDGRIPLSMRDNRSYLEAANR